MQETIAMIDVEAGQEILKTCGAECFAVHFALQVIEKPCTIVELQEFCGLSLEETRDAVTRIGIYHLGVSDSEPVKMRLVDKDTSSVADGTA